MPFLNLRLKFMTITFYYKLIFMNFDFKLIDLVMREAFCKLKKARKYFFNLVNLFYNHKMLENF